jgi:hypothetical protein
VGILITGSAAAVALTSIIDNSPHAGAVNFLKVDSGSNVAVNMISNVTANSLASGTTTTLDDGAGNLSLPGTLKLISGATITFGSAGDSDLYRLGSNSLATDGQFTTFGALNAQNLLTLAQSGSAPSVATSGTIATANLGVSRVTTAGAVTGVILASGTVAGQLVIVVNESANTITFAAVGTSHVADGTSDVIAANTARMFVWDSSNSRWYRCG